MDGLVGPVVLLAGGTGGAMLARGMLDLVGEQLTVIANTGDDVEIHGGYVSPDPDLILYRLADLIDERGFGLRDDSFAVMDGLRALGAEVWFGLGDRDLAVCIDRARRLAAGQRLTEAQTALARALGVRARVLPMSDQRVRTRVRVSGRWHDLQEFLIRVPGGAPVENVAFTGAASAAPTAEVLAAIRAAGAIVIGPSNPIISIGPILALPGIREALTTAPAPVVAVSPLVRGRALKGPTERFLQWAGHARSATGVAACYHGVIDGLVADEAVDEAVDGIPVHQTDVLMSDGPSQRRLADETLRFAATLEPSRLAMTS